MPCETAIIRLGRALPAICGAVAEWSKALAWKVSMGQKLIEGSNPSRSASSCSSKFAIDRKHLETKALAESLVRRDSRAFAPIQV